MVSAYSASVEMYFVQGCVRYGTGILATGMDVVRTYRSVRYRYRFCTEITEVG